MKILITPNFVSKLFCLLLCLTISAKLYSQVNKDKDNRLYLGQVKSDSASVELHPILESKSEIEIWFKSSNPWDNPATKENGIFKLYFSNNEWTAVYRSFIKEKSLKTIDLSSERIESIFNELVVNRIFLLETLMYPQIESYYDKGTKMVVSKKIHKGSDVTVYTIIFKVGRFYRKYEFEDPRTCYRLFPKIDECRYANNIVKIFKENFYAYKK